MKKTLDEALSELIEAIRTDVEARSTPGDRREARSYAELLPVALFVDQKRISVDLREVPEPIRGRILGRPIPLVIPAGPGKNEILDFWQRRCFDEAGYAITVLPLVPIELLTRGRRQRDEVEVRLRETLALWVWALQPAIERLAASLPEARTDEAPGLSLLATQAAFFSRYGSQSVARRPDSLADEAEPAVLTSAVHSAVTRLSDEGRKHTLVIVGPDGGRQEWSGVTLRKLLMDRAEVLLRTTGRTESASQALALVRHIDTLAKALLAATAVFGTRPEALRGFEEGMTSLAGRGVTATADQPDATKRAKGASDKVLASIRSPAYVQRPTRTTPDPIRLELEDLVHAAFFAGVDPFTFCGQHMLFAPDVFAARAVGNTWLGRPVEKPCIETDGHTARGVVYEPVREAVDGATALLNWAAVGRSSTSSATGGWDGAA